MSKYFEGYYCKDDSSVDGIRTETSRQVLRTISRHYPLGVTVDEISKQTEIPPDTVRGSLDSLEDAGFIRKKDMESTEVGQEKMMFMPMFVHIDFTLRTEILL